MEAVPAVRRSNRARRETDATKRVAALLKGEDYDATEALVLSEPVTESAAVSQVGLGQDSIEPKVKRGRKPKGGVSLAAEPGAEPAAASGTVRADLTQSSSEEPIQPKAKRGRKPKAEHAHNNNNHNEIQQPQAITAIQSQAEATTTTTDGVIGSLDVVVVVKSKEEVEEAQLDVPSHVVTPQLALPVLGAVTGGVPPPPLSVAASGVVVAPKRARHVDEYASSLHRYMQVLEAAAAKRDALNNVEERAFWMMGGEPIKANFEAESKTFAEEFGQGRMTKGRAMSEFGLSKDELDNIPCEYARNPHYRSAPPMRLYQIEDLAKVRAEKLFQHACSLRSILSQRMDQLDEFLEKKSLPRLTMMHRMSPLLVESALGNYAKPVPAKELAYTFAEVKKRMMAVINMHQFVPFALRKPKFIDLLASKGQQVKTYGEAQRRYQDCWQASQLFSKALTPVADTITAYLFPDKDFLQYLSDLGDEELVKTYMAAYMRRRKQLNRT